MFSCGKSFVPAPSPTSASLAEDPNLWLNAHRESLERKQKEFSSLNREIEMLTEINKDLGKLVNNQQPLLDETEDHVLSSLQHSEKANSILDLAHRFQNSSLALKTGVYLAVGTALGSGIGSFGLLLGIKPILALSVGGGVGAVVSGITAAVKIE